MRGSAILIVAAFMVSCGQVTPAHVESPQPSTIRRSGSVAPAPTPQPGALPEAIPPPPKPEPIALLSFKRVLEAPIKSIAVGKPPAVAALADRPWLRDAEGWEEKPLPKRYELSPQARVEIFFGRDNRPRLMGTTAVTADGSGTRAVYLRFKRASWTEDPNEIGRLGGLPHGGLFGVLGHDDPEVVCKVGDVCIVKRISGWTTLPSGPGLPRVFVQDGAVWALHPDRVTPLAAKGWTELAGKPPWTAPTGFWGHPNGAFWVSVALENALYRFDNGTWTKVPSPVKAPSGLWGTSPTDVWVTGEDGAGHFDGTTWRPVAGPEGPLAVVQGSSEKDVWLGGGSGLWHGTKP